MVALPTALAGPGPDIEPATGGTADLSLDGTTSESIDQYYIRTTAETTTTYNRVKMSWAEANVQVQVTRAKKWDSASLSWVEDKSSSLNGKASVASGTNVTTFTFTNYSTKAFLITPSFKADDAVASSLTKATFEQDPYAVGSLEVEDDGVAADKYFTDDTKTTVKEDALPKATVTATLDIDASKFDDAEDTASPQKYGTYTVTISDPNRVVATFTKKTLFPKKSETTAGFTWDELKDETNGTAFSYNAGAITDKSIEDSAFNDCEYLTSIEIPGFVTSIGTCAFGGCTSLTSVVIPDRVNTISDFAFRGCTSLAGLTYQGSVEQWNSITKGEDWSAGIVATQVICADGTVNL